MPLLNCTSARRAHSLKGVPTTNGEPVRRKIIPATVNRCKVPVVLLRIRGLPGKHREQQNKI